MRRSTGSRPGSLPGPRRSPSDFGGSPRIGFLRMPAYGRDVNRVNP
jgi:hypothetical protein